MAWHATDQSWIDTRQYLPLKKIPARCHSVVHKTSYKFGLFPDEESSVYIKKKKKRLCRVTVRRIVVRLQCPLRLPRKPLLSAGFWRFTTILHLRLQTDTFADNIVAAVGAKDRTMCPAFHWRKGCEGENVPFFSVIVARVIPKPSDLQQGAEVGAESKSCNGDSSSDYFAHESRIAPEVADNVAAAVE